MKVRQTSCRFCGLDIENYSPYRKGEWMDRGGNTHCHASLADVPEIKPGKQRKHAPYIDRQTKKR